MRRWGGCLSCETFTSPRRRDTLSPLSAQSYDLTELLDFVAFATVVDSGGFTAAAASLGVRKALVTRRVKALERRLGAQLLVRTTRSVRMTELGARLYEKASGAVALAREAHALTRVRLGEGRSVYVASPHVQGRSLRRRPLARRSLLGASRRSGRSRCRSRRFAVVSWSRPPEPIHVRTASSVAPRPRSRVVQRALEDELNGLLAAHDARRTGVRVKAREVDAALEAVAASSRLSMAELLAAARRQELEPRESAHPREASRRGRVYLRDRGGPQRHA